MLFNLLNQEARNSHMFFCYAQLLMNILREQTEAHVVGMLLRLNHGTRHSFRRISLWLADTSIDQSFYRLLQRRNWPVTRSQYIHTGWTRSKSIRPCVFENDSRWLPAEKTGRGSLLNRSSFAPDDQIGQGIKLNCGWQNIKIQWLMSYGSLVCNIWEREVGSTSA